MGLFCLLTFIYLVIFCMYLLCSQQKLHNTLMIRRTKSSNLMTIHKMTQRYKTSKKLCISKLYLPFSQQKFYKAHLRAKRRKLTQRYSSCIHKTRLVNVNHAFYRNQFEMIDFLSKVQDTDMKVQFCSMYDGTNRHL